VNPIGQNPNVTTNGGHPFTGTHTTGDILLVSDFTQGGSTSTIKVFEWVGDDATGSLVALNNGNPIGGSTFAIVNGGDITVPWSYVNKSKSHSPAAGEFLEGGVNLTALGLQGCFSSFLAETRSSQSPTATLSDFVIGSFHTCEVQLPNTASVQADNFNNGQPITSNQVIITINDGDMLEATSLGGNGAGADGLTVQQVQPIVAQAVAAWRAAGVAPGNLTNLENLTIHVDNLPGAELGFFSPGAIWIDRTAAGWGWSTTGEPGRMDLSTVVSHELGHALGFEHSASGVMEARLAAGVQLLPEALASTTTTTAAAPAATAAVSPAEPGPAAVLIVSHATPPRAAPAAAVAAPAAAASTGGDDATLAAAIRFVAPSAVSSLEGADVRNGPALSVTAAPATALSPPSRRDDDAALRTPGPRGDGVWAPPVEDRQGGVPAPELRPRSLDWQGRPSNPSFASARASATPASPRRRRPTTKGPSPW